MLRNFLMVKKKTSSPVSEYTFYTMNPVGGYAPYSAGVGNSGNSVLVNTQDGDLFLSQNKGVDWSEKDPAGSPVGFICGISPNGQCMAVGNNSSGRLYYSSNGGANWSEVQPAGDTDQTYRLVFVNNSGLILCLYGTDPQSSIMSKSTDGGSNWSNISITNPAWVGGISTDGQYLFVATESVAFSFEYRLFVSSNGGTDWTEVRPVGDTGVFWGAMAASDDNSVLLAGVYEGRLYLSVTGGTDWAEVKPAGESDRQWGSAAMDSDGTTIVTVGYPDAYVSYDGGSSWSEIFPAGSDIDIAAEVIQMTKDSVGVVISDGWTSGKAYLGVRE